MNRLQALHDAGVSIWLDTLSRELLDSGDFAGLIADSRSPGRPRTRRSSPRRSPARTATTTSCAPPSPPVCATRASSSSSSPSTTSAAPRTCCGPCTTRATGATGSSRSNAPRTSPTTPRPRSSRRSSSGGRLARPNVMIKVPATEAGHSRDRGAHRPRRQRQRHACCSPSRRYEQVIDAYIAGLERRAWPPASRSDAIASVASFFVSRVDAKVDPLLPADSGLRGRVAIANAQRPTRATSSASADERWLARSPRRRRSSQRPLWASTGTKDPAYSDVLYVEQLIAPDVINTMPEATLHAFADHGDVPHALNIAGRGRTGAPPRGKRGHRPRRHHRRARARGRALLLRILARIERNRALRALRYLEWGLGASRLGD